MLLQYAAQILKPMSTPESTAFHCSRKILLRDLILLAFSGWLTAVAFPGFNQSWIAWWTVVPLIVLCTGKSTKRAMIYGLVWGYFWNLAGCFFLREIMFWTPFIFGVVMGMFSALWAALIPLVFQNTLYPLSVRLKNCEERSNFFAHSYGGELIAAVTLSCWWVCLDWIRSWFCTGFPWGLFPVSQWQHPILLQICEYTGIYGVDFLLIFCNFAVFFLLLE